MFAAQTNPITLLCEVLRHSATLLDRSPQRRHSQTPEGLEDPRRRLIAALAEMLPSTQDELAQAVQLELATVQAYLADMAARSEVMFNPLTKRYSLPRFTEAPGFAA